VDDFLFVINELFRYILRLGRYKRNSVEVGVFRKEVGHFERKFQTEGASPINHCWYQKTRVIAFSCGINISAMHCLVLSQSTRVTNRRTDRQTDGQNYHSQDCASIAASRGNKTDVNCGFVVRT